MLQHTIYAGIGVSLTNLNLHVLHFYRLVEGPVGRGIVHVHCSVARATDVLPTSKLFKKSHA